MAEVSVKDIMAFFNESTRPALVGPMAGKPRMMTAREMVKEWKALSDKDKAQIKAGLSDGSLTY
jgi:hypothetical protein